jgi:hypothetical protein
MSSDRDDDAPSIFTPIRGGDEVQKLLEVDDAAVFIAYIPVENSDAQELLIDPLPLLRRKLPGMVTGEADWRVTINRVDAQIAAHNPGPHHLLVGGLVLKPKHEVHCTVHRSKKDPG